MGYIVDEIRMSSRSIEPVTIEDALKMDTYGKSLVIISPTLKLAEIRFESMVSKLLAQGYIESLRGHRATLKRGGEIVALSERQIEHGALRGLDVVVLV